MTKVASLQLSFNDEKGKDDRIEYVLKKMEENKDADLILLPEVWNIGYFSFDSYKEKSEKLDGHTINEISKKAKEVDAYVLAGSIIEERGDGYYNTSVLLDNEGKRIGDYSKMHLFSYGSTEAKLLNKGDKVEVVETDLGKIGICICYDLRFPELFRAMMRKGAEIFLNTSAWPFPRVANWTALNQVRALENVSYLISCNCAGINQGKQFLGHSMIVDPWGAVLACSDERERIVKAEIHREKVHEIRGDFPQLNDIVL